jgi:hypothetical protein
VRLPLTPPRIVCALALLAGLAGCGKSDQHVKIKGKLVKGGAPYQPKIEGLPPGDNGLRVGFIRTDGGREGEDFYAKVDPATGAFEVPGPDGKGIPPGKYKVTVRSGAVGTSDLLKNQFSRENSKVVREIKPGGGDLVIDLDKPEG